MASRSTSSRRASKRPRLDSLRSSRSASASDSASPSSTPLTSCDASLLGDAPQPVKSSSLSNFLEWCSVQGIIIDPRLDLRYYGDAISWSISVHAGSSISPDTVVASIPKSAVLSRKTSGLARVLRGRWLSDSHETVGLELALCLLYERCLGAASRFAPFIDILPRLPVPLPFLRQADGEQWRWIGGTEVDRIDARAAYAHMAATTAGAEWAYDHDYGMSRHKALDYWESVGIPVLRKSGLFDKAQREHLDGLQGAFLTAYTHVSSRDFIVDAHHGVALVPLADLFNHAERHTVQFEADQEVCEFCGTAALTGHEEEKCRFPTGSSEEEEGEDEDEVEDDEDEEVEADKDFSPSAVPEDNDGEADGGEVDSTGEDAEEEEELGEYVDTLDMRTLSAHAPGEELSNTYGVLTNALLLTRYGFCLDTETDVERYTMDLRFPRERHAFLEAFVSARLTHERVDAALTAATRLVAARFRTATEDAIADDEGNEDEDEEVDEGVMGMDLMWRLDTLFAGSEWQGVGLCELVSIPPKRIPTEAEQGHDEVDEDVVDRDQVHPLFLSGSGLTSRPLFLLVLLIHHLSTHPDGDLASFTSLPMSLDSPLVSAGLETLHALVTSRLQALTIHLRLDEALTLIAPDSTAPYAVKASIHHALQEHAALSSALSTYTDLLHPTPS